VLDRLSASARQELSIENGLLGTSADQNLKIATQNLQLRTSKKRTGILAGKILRANDQLGPSGVMELVDFFDVEF